MRRRVFAALCGACALTALAAAPGGDLDRARALLTAAEARAAADPGASIWVDAHREWAAIRPWQPGHAEAQRALHAIEAARRARLR